MKVDTMIEQLAMVTRIVENQNEAIEFYTESLGFELRGDHPGPHGRFVMVAPEGDENVELVLITPDGFDEDEADELSALIGRDMGLIYRVDDCRATYEELRQNGIDFLSKPEKMPWGTQAVLTDPDGNEIVVQDRPTLQ